MTYHFVNILTWKYFYDNTRSNRVIYVDGFFLQIAILIAAGKWVKKKSGLNFYSQERFESDFHLLSKPTTVKNCILLPHWESIDDITPEEWILRCAKEHDNIVIGISGPKQDRLADLIQNNLNDVGNIYCLGAAVYSKTYLNSENVFITWITMFLNAPLRTLRKFGTSLISVLSSILYHRRELRLLSKEFQND